MKHSVITYLVVAFALYGVVVLIGQLIRRPGESQSTSGITQPLLFTPSPNKSGIINLNHLGETVTRYENVELDENMLLGKETSIYAVIFGKIILINKQDKSLSPDNELFTWWGTIQDDPNSYVVFARSGEVYSGNIWWNETLYQVVFVGNDLYEIRQIDQDTFPKCGVKEEQTSPKILTPFLSETPCSNSDSFLIDVMVLYTDDIVAAVSDENIIKSEIYLTVHLTNLAYLNSDVQQRIALVYTGKLDFNENGNAKKDCDTLKSKVNVRTMRDTYSADIVALIVKSSSSFGWAMPMDVVSHNAEADAYAVVQRESSTAVYSFAHELAHLMGCKHACNSIANSLSPYHYAHGYEYVRGENAYGTIMSFNDYGIAEKSELKKRRQLLFSNPDILHNGTQMGVFDSSKPTKCQADNHQVLNQTATTVSNFRCNPSSTPNVWVKDTWEDLGQEPNPVGFGDITWNSPDIWVRNNQDPNFSQVNLHENPKLGARNWVYVNLHNGGSNSSGILELYYAEASLNQSWPRDWTKLGDTTVNMNPGTSRIVEYSWDVPSRDVDYTLLARWVSNSDQMFEPETADVAANVVKNNNIAWKNTRIISVNDGLGANVAMQFTANPGTYLEINFDKTFPRQSFAEKGIVLISFDKTTGFSTLTGSGFEKIGNNLYLATASKIRFNNLSTGKSIKGAINLSFRTKKTTPKQKYYCSLSRFEANQKSKNVSAISGIDYVINSSN